MFLFGCFFLDLHLGELGWCSAGDLSHTQIEQLILELIQLLGELLLVLGSQLGALNLHLEKKQQEIFANTLVQYSISYKCTQKKYYFTHNVCTIRLMLYIFL